MVNVFLIEPSPCSYAVEAVERKERASHTAGDNSGWPIIRLHGRNYHGAR